MKKISCICLGIVLMLSVSAWGEPIQKPPVPADAKWIVHFDMEKFRSSHLHDFLMEESFTRPFRKWNARLNKELNMDVIRDMTSISLFNAGVEEDSIVGCFRGKFDRDFIVGKINENSKFEEILSGSHTLLHWDRREYAVFVGKEMILYSNDRWAIENALKTISGGQKNLMDERDRLGSVPEAAVMFAYMKNPTRLLGLPAKSRFLDKIGSVLYHISERGDMVRSYLKMETGSKEDAENIRDIFKGLMAVARMQAPQDFEAVKFIDDVHFKITNNTMEIELEAPAEELFQILRNRMKLAGLIPGDGL